MKIKTMIIAAAATVMTACSNGNKADNSDNTADTVTVEALRMADMENDVKRMPMGLHTVVVEGSAGFSGGQKQRLLIARALIGHPQIIFFDEATSALDNISQKQVSDNLDSLNCTRLVIAHRLSTIRHCDRIIVLDKGRIAEEGNFDELMAKKGLFYEMSLRQM